MTIKITAFDSRFLDQLNQLPPEEWQSNAYDLFLHNEWQPWFHPFQIVEGNKLKAFGMLYHFENVAWLGWILVSKKHRRQGLGTSMSKFLIEKAKALGATTLLLTATELGFPIYDKLGFHTTCKYRFFKPQKREKPQIESSLIRKATKADFEPIKELDFLATSEKREKLLGAHFSDTWVHIEENTIKGFYIETLGNGLVIASTAKAGENLLRLRMRREHTTIAVPEQNEAAIKFLLKRGYTEGHSIPRMELGVPSTWKSEMIWSRASGYCG